MALFNITSAAAVSAGNDTFNFKISNMNITIDSMDLKISELQITEQEWLGN